MTLWCLLSCTQRLHHTLHTNALSTGVQQQDPWHEARGVGQKLRRHKTSISFSKITRNWLTISKGWWVPSAPTVYWLHSQCLLCTHHARCSLLSTIPHPKRNNMGLFSSVHPGILPSSAGQCILGICCGYCFLNNMSCPAVQFLLSHQADQQGCHGWNLIAVLCIHAISSQVCLRGDCALSAGMRELYMSYLSACFD